MSIYTRTLDAEDLVYISEWMENTTLLFKNVLFPSCLSCMETVMFKLYTCKVTIVCIAIYVYVSIASMIRVTQYQRHTVKSTELIKKHQSSK